jgi:two-component system, OmpR family, sensor histidine kinase KdpD
MLPGLTALPHQQLPGEPPLPWAKWLAQHRPRHRYLWALVAVALATAVAWPLSKLTFLDLANLEMVYLLAVLVVATRLGRGPSMVTTLVGVLVFVYVFVPHTMSLVLADLSYLPSFLIMGGAGFVVAELTGRLQAQWSTTAERERRARLLYELSRDLTAVEDRGDLAQVAAKHVSQAFGGASWLFAADDASGQALAGEPAPLSDEDRRLLRATMHRRRPFAAGSLGCHPLIAANEVVGVLAVELRIDAMLPAEQQLLASFANNLAIALHRLVILERERLAHLKVDEERLRNVMLSSVSHDLRTPLASITGAVTTLIDSSERLDATTRLDLMQAIREDAEGLERQVRNMLDLTRLESGTLAIRRDWHSIEEIVGCAVGRVEALLTDRPLDSRLPPDLPLVNVDAQLLEQLLVNLLENASRYTPPRTPIEIIAAVAGDRLQLVVADRGPGVPATERDAVFAKFRRGQQAQSARSRVGSGLGLAICRAVATLHGGRIDVFDRIDGGARFVLDIPTGGPQPALPHQP